jgi:hypothetical protein
MIIKLTRIIIAALILEWLIFLGTSCYAQDDILEHGDYLKENQVVDRLDIYEKDGRRKGYIEEDRFDPNSFKVYDKNGKVKGYIRLRGDLYKYEENRR